MQLCESDSLLVVQTLFFWDKGFASALDTSYQLIKCSIMSSGVCWTTAVSKDVHLESLFLVLGTAV